MKSENGFDRFLKVRARELRKAMTFSEVMLWMKLRNYGMMEYDFHRQVPLLRFIADFYCKELKLVIEVDAITHDEEEVQQRDAEKDAELWKSGITVLRFNALDVAKDIEDVLRALQHYIEGFEEKYGENERVKRRREQRGDNGWGVTHPGRAAK